MVIRLPLVLILVLCSSLIQAQVQADSNIKEVDINVATVMVDGIKLFPVHGISAYPAERRASQIRQKIEAVASDKSIPLDAIKTVMLADRILIKANDSLIMTIIEVDAERAGIDIKLLAEIYLGTIKATIEKYRQDRTPEAVWTHSLYVLGATILFVLFLFTLFYSLRLLHKKLMQRYETHISALKIKSIEILNEAQVKAAINGFVTTMKTIIVLVAIYLYLQFALSLLPWTRKFAFTLIDMTLKPLQVIGEGILEYSDNFVFLIVLIFIVRYIIKTVNMFFSALRSGRITISGFDAEWSWPTYRLVRMLIIAFALIMAFPYIPGSDSAAFQGVTLFFGVLFSLGSSTYVANIIAGYSMTYRRAFKVGNRVKIGDFIGDVKEIRLMVTHLRTLKNEEVIIPNSKILNTEVINYSTMAEHQGLILHTTVGIGYEVPWRQVEAMLLMAAQRTVGLQTEPKPYVLQKSLGDFAVNYELNVYCKDVARMMSLYSALHQNIQDVFNEYGVQIMTPAYEADTPAPKIVPKDSWYVAPAKEPGAKTE